MPDENKVRVIIDTNLLISASIVSHSYPDKLIKRWLKKAFILLISYNQLEELKEVSNRKKFENRPLFGKKVKELIENVEFVAEKITPMPEEELPIHGRDPKDDFLLACALAGGADYLITGDQDLLVLNGNPSLGKLKIISVKKLFRPDFWVVCLAKSEAIAPFRWQCGVGEVAISKSAIRILMVISFVDKCLFS